ncbi:hypothetical protein [Antrihabitans sp. YC2-6]|uniref:hypothetical protein n=1 Tax=Antrihabitans sp. YC2-6 TaxID=2799498 RepID=UPI001A34F05D|nr:hypothetical protein [Antrihabitans sp. YC2-6]MBJ8345656.1 hypothetical protein [Antrihabitans sp. YC2-6]
MFEAAPHDLDDVVETEPRGEFAVDKGPGNFMPARSSAAPPMTAPKPPTVAAPMMHAGIAPTSAIAAPARPGMTHPMAAPPTPPDDPAQPQTTTAL